ncbi:hypothetical protein BV25DRAFT_1990231 [Artomyces pyxidatus]|uniref:Uncharacterized protein n=1 Tax=Artomyces pyxidatus TaxID=48021 RepID=A0ACB8T5K9_9AGAM|nr:hypothetical protein BV25DRAFT_1990231 [Artomyces pyxidatus]
MDSEGQHTLLTTPSELLFHVFTFLDVPSILALRQTCKSLSLLTHDKGVWLDQLRHQRNSLPLPSPARDDVSALALTPEELEKIVVSAHASQHAWHRPRQEVTHLGGLQADYRDIIYLTVLLDRLVLCVYSHGSVVLWNVASNSAKMRARVIHPQSYWELWGLEPWTSAVACLDNGNEAAYVAITRAQNRTQQGSATVLMRIPLDETASYEAPYLGSVNRDQTEDLTQPPPGSRNLNFNDVDTIFGPDAQVVRTIDPAQQIIAFSRTTHIDVTHWPTNTGITLDTQREDVDQLWNGIIALQFIGPYLLCIKARTLELYPISLPFSSRTSYFVSSSLGPPTPPEPQGDSHDDVPVPPRRPVALHSFPRTTFRGASISSSLPRSHCAASAAPDETATSPIVLTLLAHDVLRGVFQYRVNIVPASSTARPSSFPIPPTLHVDLIGVHNMALGVPGFVSAAAIGPQGRRGVWVERTKKVTTRRVVVFSTPACDDAPDDGDVEQPRPVTLPLQFVDAENDLSDEEEGREDGAWGLGKPINTHPVYEVKSYDLHEDLVQVAFSEVSGLIALGTRAGAVRVI